MGFWATAVPLTIVVVLTSLFWAGKNWAVTMSAKKLWPGNWGRSRGGYEPLPQAPAPDMEKYRDMRRIVREYTPEYVPTRPIILPDRRRNKDSNNHYII